MSVRAKVWRASGECEGKSVRLQGSDAFNVCFLIILPSQRPPSHPPSPSHPNQYLTTAGCVRNHPCGVVDAHDPADNRPRPHYRNTRPQWDDSVRVEHPNLVAVLQPGQRSADHRCVNVWLCVRSQVSDCIAKVWAAPPYWCPQGVAKVWTAPPY